MNFCGPATPITEGDINNAADILSCPPAAIKAVLTVETSGSGFLPDGRPTILFESKYFHKYTGGIYDVTHPNLSTPKWDKTTYGKGGAHQYDRLETAISLDEEAALKSASWGLFQIMGANHESCGFDNVYSFVETQVAGGGQQLEVFCRFIQTNKKMHVALQNLDWPTFAKLYNGPGYAANQYDVKLAAAYNKHEG